LANFNCDSALSVIFYLTLASLREGLPNLTPGICCLTVNPNIVDFIYYIWLTPDLFHHLTFYDAKCHYPSMDGPACPEDEVVLNIPLK